MLAATSDAPVLCDREASVVAAEFKQSRAVAVEANRARMTELLNSYFPRAQIAFQRTLHNDFPGWYEDSVTDELSVQISLGFPTPREKWMDIPCCMDWFYATLQDKLEDVYNPLGYDVINIRYNIAKQMAVLTISIMDQSADTAYVASK